MNHFDAARELYGEAPESVGRLLADAEREGVPVVMVHLVTDLGPAPGAKGVTFTRHPLTGRRWVTVVVPAALAVTGTHTWGGSRNPF